MLPVSFASGRSVYFRVLTRDTVTPFQPIWHPTKIVLGYSICQSASKVNSPSSRSGFMISRMTRTRRDFFSALSGVIVVYAAPSPESQPDYITYWLFEFDEAMDSRNFCEARSATAELKAALLFRVTRNVRSTSCYLSIH
jgi:hypothetical protein